MEISIKSVTSLSPFLGTGFILVIRGMKNYTDNERLKEHLILKH